MASVMVPFGFCGIIYMILAAQIQGGFPPFYKAFSLWPAQQDIISLFPALLALSGIIALLGLTGFVPLVAGLGVVGLWFGWQIRGQICGQIKRAQGGPLPWTMTPMTAGVLVKWPMLLFDAWTVGLVVVAAAVMFTT